MSLRHSGQVGWMLAITGCLALVFACIFGSVAIQHRTASLPAFHMRLGQHRIVASMTDRPECPPHLHCPPELFAAPAQPHFVVWVLHTTDPRRRVSEAGQQALNWPLPLWLPGW